MDTDFTYETSKHKHFIFDILFTRSMFPVCISFRFLWTFCFRMWGDGQWLYLRNKEPREKYAIYFVFLLLYQSSGASSATWTCQLFRPQTIHFIHAHLCSSEPPDRSRNSPVIILWRKLTFFFILRSNVVPPTRTPSGQFLCRFLTLCLLLVGCIVLAGVTFLVIRVYKSAFVANSQNIHNYSPLW